MAVAGRTGRLPCRDAPRHRFTPADRLAGMTVGYTGADALWTDLMANLCLV